MIRRKNRINFRLTDQEFERYAMLIVLKPAGYAVRNWSDLCKMSLREMWKHLGSPEPPPAAESLTADRVSDADLFTVKKRSRSAPTSAPTRPSKRKRAKR